MKNARMIPKPKTSFLIILLSYFLLTVHTTESTQSLPDLEDPSLVSPSESDSDLAIENQDWILNPALTKLLLVEFKGNGEEVFFEFRSEGAESSTFKVSTIVNGNTVDTQIKQFPQEEVLSAHLDYQAKEGLVIGDNGFTISYPLQEDFYEVIVAQERVDTTKPMLLMTQKSESNTTVIIGTVGGSCGLLILLTTFGFIWKRRKSSKDLSIKCPNSAALDQKLNRENLYSTTPIKNSTSDFELGAKLGLDCKFKKESSNSQASTIATMGRIESQESNKSFLVDNGDFGTITEVEDDQKQSPYVSFPNKKDDQNKLLITTNNKTILKSQESVVAKLPPKRKSKSTLDIDIALDMDLEVDIGERRMPTLAQIKALVRKMEEEGTIGQDCDPSEDTDEEDQYEAPALPNYFCCMLCFEGKRCTIVEPCRHVFACHDCVKELLDTYKICALCARPISSFEPL